MQWPGNERVRWARLSRWTAPRCNHSRHRSIQRALDAFVALAGARTWSARMAEIHRLAASGPRAGQAIRQRHAVELAIERLRGTLQRPASTTELHAARLAGEAVALAGALTRTASAAARAAAGGPVRRRHARAAVPPAADRRAAACARLPRRLSRVWRTRLRDLLLARGNVEAEVVCEVVSAEEGRLVQRGAWSRLADRVDADLRAWLVAPSRPLPAEDDAAAGPARAVPLAAMHGRIRRLLETRGRRDHERQAVLRLDPLVLAGAVRTSGLMPSLRREFGPEAHLSVTAAAMASS